MTPATLARWLKEVLSLAGVVDAKARSVRSVGSSTAAQGSLDMKRILDAGDWSRTKTFQRHYFRPQTLETISDKVIGVCDK